MKINKFGLAAVLCIMIFLAGACKKSAADRRYQQSYSSWQAFKDSAANNYQYTKTYSSWTGSQVTYTITVRKGVVVRQEYEAYWMNQTTHRPELLAQWIENADEIDSHDPYSPAQTLDEVYARAKNEWLRVDRDENTIIFETKNRGMISICGYIPKNCADDCLNGITITEIKGLTKNP